MGDSGSLALGGLFSAIALTSNSEIILLLIGGVFLIEIFAYTPIHYAFVLKGHKETTVVSRFYLLTLALTIIGVIVGIL